MRGGATPQPKLSEVLAQLLAQVTRPKELAGVPLRCMGMALGRAPQRAGAQRRWYVRTLKLSITPTACAAASLPRQSALPFPPERTVRRVAVPKRSQVQLRRLGAAAAAMADSGQQQAPSSAKTPADFLKSIKGKPVIVKLNSGVDYRGAGLSAERRAGGGGDGSSGSTPAARDRAMQEVMCRASPSRLARLAGVLACLDGYMNIAMEQTEEYVNGQVRTGRLVRLCSRRYIFGTASGCC